MHFFRFNLEEYIAHTGHLDEFEDLAYRRMLDLYYLHESPLPKEPERVAKLIRMRTHCEQVTNVLQEFFEPTEDGWRNARADAEIAEYQEKSAKAKKSADARWAKYKKKNKDLGSEKGDNANAEQAQSEGNAKQETINNKQQSTVAEPDSRPPLIKYSCIKDEVFVVYKEDVLRWQKTFPAVDVVFQLNKIQSWLIDNPTKKKTKKGMPAMINRWLSKEQDRGGGSHTTSAAKPKKIPVVPWKGAEQEEFRKQHNLPEANVGEDPGAYKIRLEKILKERYENGSDSS